MSSCDSIGLWFLISWLVPCTDWSAFLSSNFLYFYLTSKVLVLFFLTRNSCLSTMFVFHFIYFSVYQFLLHTLYFPLPKIFHGKYYKIYWSSHKHVHGIYYYKTLCVIYLMVYYYYLFIFMGEMHTRKCLNSMFGKNTFIIGWGNKPFFN